MGSFTGYVIVYVLGGVTFLPLLIVLLFLHAYLTLKPAVKQDDSSSAAANGISTNDGPVDAIDGTSTSHDVNNNSNNNNNSGSHYFSHHSKSNSNGSNRKSLLPRPNDDQFSLKSGTDVLAEKFQRAHESDVAAGYFAVCRDYVPGGVNGKPPERTTPAGEVVGTESQSPSVYQSMYRSIFERRQTSASIEPTNNNGRNFKKARNVFYIVLRYVFFLFSSFLLFLFLALSHWK